MGINFNHSTGLISTSAGKLELKDSGNSAPLVSILLRFIEKYMHGLEISWVSNSQVKIAKGYCRDAANTVPINVESEITIDITASGANGRQVGLGEATNFLYHVYLIGDSDFNNSPAGLLSDSVSVPTLPSGYDVYRRLGSILNNGASNIEPFFQSGIGNQRYMYYNVDPVAQTHTRLVGGSDETAFTSAFASGVVPATSRQILIQVRMIGNDTSVSYFRMFGLSADPLLRYQPTQSEGRSYLWVPANGSQSFQYRIGNNLHEISIWVVGYIDNL